MMSEESDEPKTWNYCGYRIINFLCLVIALTLNYVSSAGILSDYGVGDVSRNNPCLITPASYAFSIWAVIYVLTGIAMVYQLFAKQSDELLFEKLGWYVSAQWIVNGAWICVFVQDQDWSWILSPILIFTLLALLMLIVHQIESEREFLSWAEYISYYLGFNIYAGWVTGACIVNLSAAIRRFGWADGSPSMVWTEENWTITIGIVALLIYFSVAYKYTNGVYPAVYTWVSVAIAVEGGGRVERHDNISTAFYILAGINALVSIFFIATNVYGHCVKKSVSDDS